MKLVFSSALCPFVWAGFDTLVETKSFYLPLHWGFMPRWRGGQAGGQVHKAQYLWFKTQKIPSVQSLKCFQAVPGTVMWLRKNHTVEELRVWRGYQPYGRGTELLQVWCFVPGYNHVIFMSFPSTYPVSHASLLHLPDVGFHHPD